MKRYILYMLFLQAFISKAQNNTQRPGSPLTAQAQRYLHKGTFGFNPDKAFSLYKLSAEQGDPKAMNGLGILYSEGIGVAKNESEALAWFQKAASHGYTMAWYNLGMAYKNGIGTKQNFERAYKCFEKGAEANSAFSIYAKGFMLYKGLGCAQNYSEAFKLFRIGSEKKDSGAMYMLGLCYRNGYGIAADADSAKHWLELSSKRGYRQATEELAATAPENITAHTNKTSSRLISTGIARNQKTYQRIKQQIDKKNIEGLYNGYVIKYDWSGKNVISRTPLTVELKANGSKFSGVWKEDSTTVKFEASLTDSAFLFSNTKYSQKDHYNRIDPNVFQFKDVRLQLIKSKDSIYLAGNLQLYSLKLREPEKPMYISLVRQENNKILNTKLLGTPADGKAEAPINAFNNSFALSEVVAYPNPFTKDLQIDFRLNEKSKVALRLTDMAGKLVYQGSTEILPAGKYHKVIQTDLPAGSYLLGIRYNDELKSVVVLKQ